MPKLFFNDLGLRNSLVNYFEPVEIRLDKGALIENYTYTRLRDLYHYDSIHFWRTTDGNELDFIVNESYLKGKAFEVKFSESEFAVNKYKKFTNTYVNYDLKCIAYKKIENAISLMRL